MSALAQALLAFQADAPALQRDAINPHFRSKFISLESLMTAVVPVANKHGLVITQFPTVVDGQPALRTRIVHAESGESLEDRMLLMPAKTDPQGQGSAITYARRYALMAALGLVADEDDDGNAASKSGAEPRRSTPAASVKTGGSPAGDPATEASAPETPFKAPKGPRGGKVNEIEVRELADTLRELVTELGATDSLPKIQEKQDAGDAAWLRRQIETAKSALKDVPFS